MKKNLSLIIVLLMSTLAFSQTPIHSFVCQIRPGYTEFTQNQIETYISKSNMESFRLQDARTTLTFSNGFEIILLSAKELQAAGLITNVSSYKAAFAPNYKLPKFYLNQIGQIGAESTITNSKYSTRPEN